MKQNIVLRWMRAVRDGEEHNSAGGSSSPRERLLNFFEKTVPRLEKMNENLRHDLESQPPPAIPGELPRSAPSETEAPAPAPAPATAPAPQQAPAAPAPRSDGHRDNSNRATFGSTQARAAGELKEAVEKAK